MKDCGTPKVLEIKCPGEVVLLHKVIVTPDMGDETTFPPKVGLYKNVLLQYQSSGNIYLYSSDGVPTKIEDTADIARLEQMIEDEIEDRIEGDEALHDEIVDEAEARDAADQEIWTEIETIEAASDVVDVVGTYAELQAYDTSTLHDKDLIKVLQDETRDDAITYYRWSTTTETFSYVGEEGPYYTQSQTDTLLDGKQDTLIAGSNIQIAADGKTISATDTTYTAGANIQINNGVISATDTTYSDFTGTDGTVAGVAGLVPAPNTSDFGKFLSASGAWETITVPPSVTVISTPALSYASASSTDAMSQLGVYRQVHADNDGIQIGGNGTAATAGYSSSVAIGGNSIASNVSTVALGNGARTNATYATALGASTYAYRQYSTAIGYNSYAYGLYSVALGASSGTGTSSSSSYGQYTVAIGYSTNIMGTECVAVGAGAAAGSSNTCGYNTAVGRSASAGVYSNNNTAIGYKATTRGQSGYSTAIGANANNNTTNYGTTLGASAQNVTGNYNVVLGYMSKADTGNSSDPHYGDVVVSVGDGSSNANYGKRKIINVKDGTEASDAATVGQLPTTMTGASSSTAGTSGLVPAPAAGDDTKFLAGDGTWQTVQGGGSAVVDFYIDADWGGSPQSNINLYADPSMTVPATIKDIYDAAMDGGARVNYQWAGGYTIDNAWMSIEASYDDDDGYYAITFVQSNLPCFFNIVGPASQTYIDISGTNYSQRIQPQLIAGSNISIGYDNTISATDTTYSDFTGATSSVAGSNGLVPAPSAGDEGKVLLGDGTWGDATAKLVEMSYGESNAWAKFLAAYQAGSIVYCRASSNANPATGSQTRKAFMAYVNNASSPTSVEFQYVRSNSSKSDSSQCDQVFVYKLTNSNGGTWTVESRDMAPKILVDSTLNKTFSGGSNASVTLGAKAMTGATSSAAGAAGVVPAPAAGDEDKFLAGDGTWKTAGGGGNEITIIVTDKNPQMNPDYMMAFSQLSSSAQGVYMQSLSGTFMGSQGGYVAFLSCSDIDDPSTYSYVEVGEMQSYFDQGYKINLATDFQQYQARSQITNFIHGTMLAAYTNGINDVATFAFQHVNLSDKAGITLARDYQMADSTHSVYRAVVVV